MGKKEFKLRPDLEALVGGANNSSILRYERFNKKLKDSTKNFYANTNNAGLTEINPDMLDIVNPEDFYEMLNIGKNQIHQNLEGKIDNNTLTEARSFYLSSLDENHKNLFYTQMLSDSMVPKAPDEKASKEDKEKYNALLKAKEELYTGDAIKQAIAKNDIDTAEALVGKYADPNSLRLLAIYGKYNAPVAREAEKELYLDIANVRRHIAAQIIKEKKLYNLIDEGIKQHPAGKAYSLVGMYNAYNTQIEFNKRKAEAEKQAKKAA